MKSLKHKIYPHRVTLAGPHEKGCPGCRLESADKRLRDRRMDQFNWTDKEIAYLVNLTGVDCVRLHGSPERDLRKLAQKVHAKLKIIQGGNA